MSFSGKTLVIVGAAGGIGAALVRAALTRGACVLAVDCDETGLRRLVAENPAQNLSTCCASLFNPDFYSTVEQRCLDTFGAYSIWIKQQKLK